MAKTKKNTFSVWETIRIIGKVLYWLIFAALILVAGLIAVSNLKIPGNYKLFAVQSGSMEPSIRLGSIVVIKPEKTYAIGDVITFVDPQNPKITVTHRIFELRITKGSIVYTTKGDANKTPDSELRPASSVLGKVIFTIPLVGYPVSFAKTRDGLIILIVIPATLIIYSELVTIKNETVRLLKERRKRKLTLAEKAEVEVGEEEIKVEKWYKRLFRKK